MTRKAVAIYPIRISGKRVAAGNTFDCEDPGLIAVGAARYVDEVSVDGDGEGGDGGEVVTTGSTPANETVQPVADVDGDTDGDTDGDVGQSLDDRIRALLGEWVAEDPEFENQKRFTKDGRPRNSAVDKALGENVTNDVIDPIFDELIIE